MTESYINNPDKELNKITAGIITHTTAATTTDTVEVTHGLGRFPAIKVYFTHSGIDKLILVISGELTSNADLYVTEWGNAEVRFSLTTSIIEFSFINENASSRDMTAYYVLYSNRASQ